MCSLESTDVNTQDSLCSEYLQTAGSVLAFGINCRLAMAVGTLGVVSSAPSALLCDPYVSPITGEVSEFIEKPSNFFKDAQLISGRLGI